MTILNPFTLDPVDDKDATLAVISNSETIDRCLQDLHGFVLRTEEPEVLEIITTILRANRENMRLCKSIASRF
ncbi:MAG: hypothetical protein KDJ97_25435 [Anaerolineae bacterium]|nr:hypothetical protein [Anaerolineae bacterium]